MNFDIITSSDSSFNRLVIYTDTIHNGIFSTMLDTTKVIP